VFPVCVSETSLTIKATKDATSLQYALNTSKVHIQGLGMAPDDAKQQIAKYQMLASDTQQRLPTIQAEVDIVIDQAKTLMAEGKDIIQKAQASVVCK